MYKLTPQYQQISIFDFNQPGGLQLSSDNRWVQLADSLEWSKYEELNAEQFPSKTGRPGIPFRIAFGAYIIQYYMLNLSSYLIYSIINSYSACTK